MRFKGILITAGLSSLLTALFFYVSSFFPGRYRFEPSLQGVVVNRYDTWTGKIVTYKVQNDRGVLTYVEQQPLPSEFYHVGETPRLIENRPEYLKEGDVIPDLPTADKFKGWIFERTEKGFKVVRKPKS